MLKIRLSAIIVLVIGFTIGFFVYTSQVQKESNFLFKLGLDLSGGTHLVYRADVSDILPGEVGNSMDALRDVIERRVNLFGVSEPIVQVETTSGIFTESQENRLIVELPGITDIDEAVAMIGQTPLLEFKLERPAGSEKDVLLEQLEEARLIFEAEGEVDPSLIPQEDVLYIPTELTGRYVERATLSFGGHTNTEPTVLLDFDKEGGDIFAQLTKDNTGKVMAIYLDGAPISTPVIREEIRGGSAVISGGFTPQEAKELVGRLNSGALPVPIELLSSQTIGASLGEVAKASGIKAGIIGLILVAIFMLLWYRLPGIVAIVALGIYIVIMLALFKIIPVTLTAAGIAGFILSIGMAVDANVLIFERMKEELHRGVALREAIEQGFKRAWLAIRDGNISSIITAIILFWFGTSLIKGFALVFGIGVLMSMFTAITVTRTLLLAISKNETGRLARFVFGSGISK